MNITELILVEILLYKKSWERLLPDTTEIQTRLV